MSFRLPQNPRNFVELFRKIQFTMPRLSAKERRRKKEWKEVEKELDRLSPTRLPRGRPTGIIPKEVEGRSQKFQYIFNQVWDDLWPLLSQATTEQQVEKAFQSAASTYYNKSEIWDSNLVLRIITEPKFPRTRDAQVSFFADSLAALGEVAPRSSRDICAKERARKKRKHYIVRFEVWIECSCGFKGRSFSQACPKCKTEVPFPWNSPFPI